MSGSEPAAIAAHSGFKWKMAIPALGLALAGLANAAPASDDAPASITTPKPCGKPQYTQSALRNDAEGTTTVNFLIDTDGSVAEAAVAKSSGDAMLDEAARAAIAKCRFTPAMAGNKPARAWVPVQYVWSLG